MTSLRQTLLQVIRRYDGDAESDAGGAAADAVASPSSPSSSSAATPDAAAAVDVTLQTPAQTPPTPLTAAGAGVGVQSRPRRSSSAGRPRSPLPLPANAVSFSMNFFLSFFATISSSHAVETWRAEMSFTSHHQQLISWRSPSQTRIEGRALRSFCQRSHLFLQYFLIHPINE